MLESRLAATPDDLETRVKLIGAAFLNNDPGVQARRREHLKWLARMHPEIDLGGYAFVPGPEDLPEDYPELRDLWLDAVSRKPTDLRVLEAAAGFLRFHDAAIAGEICRKAVALAPDDIDWRRELANTYVRLSSGAASEDERRRHAASAMREFQAALGMTDDADDRIDIQMDIARAAADALDWPVAVEAARYVLQEKECIRGEWNYGNVIHRANIVLGRAALASDDVDAAEGHLIAAGETPGSPQLDSFGPDLELAAELLHRGRRDVVVSYLRACKRFWKDNELVIDEWLASIARGELPEFARTDAVPIT